MFRVPLPSPRPPLRSLRGSFADRPVLILGLARQGRALLHFFAAQRAQVTASDRQAIALDFVSDLPAEAQVRFVFGRQTTDLLTSCELLCLAGGVDPGLPVVQAAIQRCLPVLNDTLLTFARTPCPILLITGSSGKTTTTALTGAILTRGAHADRRVHVGGNIGQPLLPQVAQIKQQDLLLWEGSSFQLELLDPAIMRTAPEEVQLDTVALLNVTPNHLDRHGGMRAYLQAKLRALYALKPGGTLVLNADDPVCQHLLPTADPTRLASLDIPEAGICADLLQRGRTYLSDTGVRVLSYTMQSGQDHAVRYDRQAVWLEGERLASLQGLRLRGRHNLSNALAACTLAHVHGCTGATMEATLRHFTAVPHRLEEVACQDGVLWVNDSIATAPERAIAGINSMYPETDHLIVLAGGKDKQLPWHQFAQTVLRHVQILITFGADGVRIAEEVQSVQARESTTGTRVQTVDSLGQAVAAARRTTRSGSIVLLSPGAASFDAFADYEARGECFRQLVLADRTDT